MLVNSGFWCLGMLWASARFPVRCAVEKMKSINATKFRPCLLQQLECTCFDANNAAGPAGNFQNTELSSFAQESQKGRQTLGFAFYNCCKSRIGQSHCDIRALTALICLPTMAKRHLVWEADVGHEEHQRSITALVYSTFFGHDSVFGRDQNVRCTKRF